MDETTYKFLMGGSAFVIAILGGMLWTTIISPESGLDKLQQSTQHPCIFLFRVGISQSDMLFYRI